MILAMLYADKKMIGFYINIHLKLSVRSECCLDLLQCVDGWEKVLVPVSVVRRRVGQEEFRVHLQEEQQGLVRLLVPAQDPLPVDRVRLQCSVNTTKPPLIADIIFTLASRRAYSMKSVGWR